MHSWKALRFWAHLPRSAAYYRGGISAASCIQFVQRIGELILHLRRLHHAVNTHHDHHGQHLLSLWRFSHLALRHRARRSADFHAARPRHEPSTGVNRRCSCERRGYYEHACGHFHRCRYDDFHVGKGAFEQLGRRSGCARSASKPRSGTAREVACRKEARTRNARSSRRT